MVETREAALGLVREFRARIAPLYGDRLEGVYLFGSFARDEANTDSDIDVAVILKGPVERWAETREVSDISADISLREDCVMVPLVFSDQEIIESPWEIHRDIIREGMRV